MRATNAICSYTVAKQCVRFRDTKARADASIVLTPAMLSVLFLSELGHRLFQMALQAGIDVADVAV